MAEKPKNDNIPEFDDSDQITPTSEILRINMLELQVKDLSARIRKLSESVDGRVVSSTNLKNLTNTVAILIETIARMEEKLEAIQEDLSTP